MIYRGMLAAAAAVFACAPASAQWQIGAGCAGPNGCDIATSYPLIDYTVLDDGHTYKWTFVLSEPGATIWLSPPNEVQYFGAIRTASGYREEPDKHFDYRFDETVAPNLTTIIVSAPKGQPFTCNQPGPIGERCYAEYVVWGNAETIRLTGIPDGVDTVHVQAYVQAIPEPTAWAMMLLGFGAIGAGARRRYAPPRPNASCCAASRPTSRLSITRSCTDPCRSIT